MQCLALGNGRTSSWTNKDNEYWQNVLNAKTGSDTRSTLLFTGGEKVVSYDNGVLLLTGQFEGVGVKLDPRAPDINFYTRKILKLRVRPAGGFLLIDAIDQNEITTVVEVGGRPSAPTRSTQQVSVGDRFPFKCRDNVLAITEQGLAGPVTTTYSLQSSTPAS